MLPKEIIAFIANAPNDKTQRELLELMFTPEELVQLRNRLSIIKSLVRGKETQRQLAARLKIGIAKITRGSNALKRISPQLNDYLEEVFHE